MGTMWPQNYPTHRTRKPGRLFTNTQESLVEGFFCGCNSFALLAYAAQAPRASTLPGGPGGHRETHQTQKDKYCMISLPWKV